MSYNTEAHVGTNYTLRYNKDFYIIDFLHPLAPYGRSPFPPDLQVQGSGRSIRTRRLILIVIGQLCDWLCYDLGDPYHSGLLCVASELYIAVQYITVQYCTYSTVQYSTV